MKVFIGQLCFSLCLLMPYRSQFNSNHHQNFTHRQVMVSAGTD